MDFWLWQYVDEHGKRRQTRYRLTESAAHERLGPTAERLEWSREVRKPLGYTSDFLRGVPNLGAGHLDNST